MAAQIQAEWRRIESILEEKDLGMEENLDMPHHVGPQNFPWPGMIPQLEQQEMDWNSAPVLR